MAKEDLMKILIAGIGIVGKSTFRRRLKDLLASFGISVSHYDADKFEEIRDSRDADMAEPLTLTEPKTIYLVEDVRGTVQDKWFKPITEYDKVIYLRPGDISYFIFWLSRIWVWEKIGHFSWDRIYKWKGTGRPYDPKNIPPILKEFWRNWRLRRKWIREDIEIMSMYDCEVIYVRPFWTPWGIIFKAPWGWL